MNPQCLARHTFVWLVPGHSAGALFVGGASGIDAENAHRVLADWCARAYPLIVARQDPSRIPAGLRLGLPLPPALGRHRLAFDVPHALIQRHAPPPRLSRVARMLPTPWQATLRGLIDAALPCARQARVFGSAALQAITAQPCLAPHSDIDLLFHPASRDETRALLGLLGELDGAACPRLDGEIVDARGRAANWRELAAGAQRIVVKRINGVELVGRDDFLAGLEPDTFSAEGLACT